MLGLRYREGGGLVLLCVVTILVVAGACGRSVDHSTGAAGSAGTEATPGVAGTGKGGDSEPGLAGIGGAGTSSGDGDGAGDGGAAGSPSPASRCSLSADCGQGFCRFPDQTCVSCLVHSNCTDSQACVGGSCVDTTICLSDADCVEGKQCDPMWRRCMECVTDAHCGVSSACISGQCQPITACKNSLDCAVGVCDRSVGRCVECLSFRDCKAGQGCAGTVCVSAPSCVSDGDCKAERLLCDTPAGQCVQCLANADCPVLHHCTSGRCEPDLCEPGKSVCINDAVALCTATGDGVSDGSACVDGEHCNYSAGRARCGHCARRSLDVVWAIDNGSSMGAEPLAYGAVVDQVHQALKKQGVDVRTVLVSLADPTLTPCSADHGVCVPPPTGAATCTEQTTEFLPVSRRVKGDVLAALAETYRSWQSFLRSDVQKAFIIVSNQSDFTVPSTTGGPTQSATFTDTLNSFSPPLGAWTLSGVLCASASCGATFSCSNMPISRCAGAEPFISLVKETDGFTVDFCTANPGATVMPIVSGLLSQVTPPSCQ